MKDFKFFQKKERVFSDWMNQMDDYHLGGIRPSLDVARNYDVLPVWRCAGVSQVRYSSQARTYYKHLVFEHIENGTMISTDLINNTHPMWNYERVITTRFYSPR
jgi:hypothetical protein